MDAEFTLLYTDLVGSTAVNDQLGDAGMAAWWLRHDRGFRDLLRLWRGREIDRSDGFAVLFEAVTDAAAFATAYHQLLANLPVPMQARAGLHLGQVTLRANSEADVALGAKPFDVMGIARAYSARLMALSQGGQTLVSEAAAQALATAAEAKHGNAPRCHLHGHYRLKGVAEPQPVWELADEQAPLLPPADSEKAQRVLRVRGQWAGLNDVPHSLPAERDGFVGRAAELRALAQVLASPDSPGARLLTLQGPGGMGKTRLAQRFGWGWRGDFPGGVWFCDLTRARDTNTLLHAVALGLNVPLGDQPAAQLQRALAGHGRCLLVLDNCEPLVATVAATLGPWLDAAPGLRCLATSRERLGVRGEHTLALGSLPADEAVALFHQRAAAHHSAYAPQAEDEAPLRNLVQQLDGLPLALELAAARVSVLSPAAMLARLGERFRLLARRGEPGDRQATLQATLDEAWEALVPAERAALAQWSVFEGRFTAAAAQAVACLDALPDAPWAPDLLQSLVDKSLVQAHGQGRFGLLRSVQDYAAQALSTEGRFPGSGPGLQGAARLRHGRFYATLQPGDVTAQRCAELDNVLAACRRAVARQDVAVATACLPLVWAGVRSAGPLQAAVELAEGTAALPGLDLVALVSANCVRATAQFTLGQLEAARHTASQALATLEAAGGTAEPVLRATLHGVLGDVARDSGHPEAAQRHLEQALALAQAADHAATLCHALNALGVLAGTAGRLEDARAFYERGLDLAVTHQDLRWQSALLGNLGWVHHSEGRLDAAHDAYTRALTLAHEGGDLRFEGNTRGNLGLIHHDQGRWADAERELNTALAMARQMGLQGLEGGALCNLGVMMASQGRHERASDYHADAVAIAAATGDLQAEGMFRNYLGAALAHTGRFDEARACLRRGQQLLMQVNDPLNLGLLLCTVAECEQLAQDWRDASQALHQARGLLETHGWPATSELAKRLETLAERNSTLVPDAAETASHGGPRRLH